MPCLFLCFSYFPLTANYLPSLAVITRQEKLPSMIRISEQRLVEGTAHRYSSYTQLVTLDNRIKNKKCSTIKMDTLIKDIRPFILHPRRIFCRWALDPVADI